MQHGRHQEFLASLRSADEATRIGLLGDLARSDVDSEEVGSVLEAVANTDESVRVRYSARRLLAQIRGATTSGSQAAFGPHALALGDRDPSRRIRAIGEIVAGGDCRHLAALLDCLAVETDVQVLATLLLAIGRLGKPTELPILAGYINHQDERVRANVIEGLYCLNTPVSLPLIVPFLEDSSNRVRANAAVALRRLGVEGALKVVEKMIESPHLWMRASAVHALGLFDADVALPILERCKDDPSPAVREKVSQVRQKLAAPRPQKEAPAPLDGPSADPKPGKPARIGGEASEAPAAMPANDPSAPLRPGLSHVDAVIAARDRDGLARLIDELGQEEDRFVISRVLSAIGILEEPGFHDILVQHLNHPDSRVAANAVWALSKLRDTAARERVAPLLGSMHPRLRANAIRYFANDNSEDLREPLREMLQSRDLQAVISALFCLAEIPRPDLLDLVDDIPMSRSDASVRSMLLGRLQGLTGRELPQAQAVRDRLAAPPRARAPRPTSGVFEARAPSAVPGESPTPDGAKVLVASWRDFLVLARLLAAATDLGLALAAAAVTLAVAGRVAGPPSSAVCGSVLAAAALAFACRDLFFERSPGRRMLGLALRLPPRWSPAGHLLRQLPIFLPPWGLLELWAALRHPEGQRPIDHWLGVRVVAGGAPLMASLLGTWLSVGLVVAGSWALSPGGAQLPDESRWVALSGAQGGGTGRSASGSRQPDRRPARRPAPAAVAVAAGTDNHTHETMGLRVALPAGWAVASRGSSWLELRPSGGASGVSTGSILLSVADEEMEGSGSEDGWARALVRSFQLELARERLRLGFWMPVERGAELGGRSGRLYRGELASGEEAVVFAVPGSPGFGVACRALATGRRGVAEALAGAVLAGVAPLPDGPRWRAYSSPFLGLAFAVPEGWRVDRDSPGGVTLRPLGEVSGGWLRISLTEASEGEVRRAPEARAGDLFGSQWKREGFQEVSRKSIGPADASGDGLALELQGPLRIQARLRTVRLDAPVRLWIDEWLEREALQRGGALEGVMAGLEAGG